MYFGSHFKSLNFDFPEILSRQTVGTSQILKPLAISVVEIPKSRGVERPASLDRLVFKIPPPIFLPPLAYRVAQTISQPSIIF